jgi:hypothetical protein
MGASYGQFSVLFTGDAEAETEAEFITRDAEALAATIDQVGHHGSYNSSSPALVAAIRPEVAVYSAGKANSYGYLHREALERLAIAGVMVYGTDVHDSVTVAGDGVGYTVTTDRAGEAPPARWRQRASSGRRRHRARVPARARWTSTPPEPKNWTGSPTWGHNGPPRSWPFALSATSTTLSGSTGSEWQRWKPSDRRDWPVPSEGDNHPDDEIGVFDRLTEGRAVVFVGEEEAEYHFEAADFPGGTREGSWLRVRRSGGTLVVVGLAAAEEAGSGHPGQPVQSAPPRAPGRPVRSGEEGRFQPWLHPGIDVGARQLSQRVARVLRP